MRQIVLDTETTGLDPQRGHRVIEIGCVELRERRRTGLTFQRYLNPERDIDLGALEVTGITSEFLQDKPRFAEVVDEFLAFIDGAELIIHNAAFDLAFLDVELALLGRAERIRDRAQVVDTLAVARERYPGQRNSLDALCRRLAVDNAHRTLHGALLDASLLADVYLAMSAGQGDLGFAQDVPMPRARQELARPAAVLRVVCASLAELALHQARLATIEKVSRGRCLWLELDPRTEAGSP